LTLIKTNNTNAYQASHKLSKNGWITDPRVEDPANLPIPLGWCVLIRPYPIKYKSKSGLVMPDSEVDFMNYTTNIGRVVAIGRSAFTKPDHKDKNGNFYQWFQIGDFVSWPKNVGSRRLYKNVSYVLLVDDDVNEVLPDPQVFDDAEAGYQLDLPEDHLSKYRTIFNKEIQ
jgi:co-chaperonin GroES (HSP10)